MKKSTRAARPVGSGKHISDAVKALIIKLRTEDPKRWTFVALAKRFKSTDGMMFYVTKTFAVAEPAPRKSTKKAEVTK